jgi:hypothetical protein
VTPDDIRQLLFHAAAVRMPRLDGQSATQTRIGMVEDYLNLTAITRGELEEARLHTYAAMAKLHDEWDTIEGWETALRRSGSRITQQDVVEAKASLRPDLHDAIKDAKWLIRRLSEQIERLRVDDAAASRLYTMITGG